MLTALSIRDVVLIERLDLSFDAGLTVLTGETGAGKSILLDSLGLALGVRAEAGLPRLDNMLLFGACEAVRAGRARARGRRRAARRGGGDPRVHIFFPFSFRSASGGSANEELGEEVAYELNAPLGRMKLGRYADGEISVQVLDNVRGKDVVRVPSRLRGARSSGDARHPRPPPLACAPAAAPPPYAPNFSLSCSRRRSP